MLDQIHFRNVEPELEQDLYTKLAAMAGGGLDIGIKALFERSAKGVYTGSIHALSEWGAVHVRFEDTDIYRLYHRLKKVVRGKIRRQKERAVRLRHPVTPMPADFPRRSPNITDPWTTMEASIPEPVMADFLSEKSISVLVVDDDAEATVPIDRIFRGYGCATTFAFTTSEAFRKLNTARHDIIILDWQLDIGTGSDLIRSIIADAKNPNINWMLPIVERPRIITYSGVGAEKVTMPDNRLFMHVDHWEKPLRYNEMMARASDILEEIGA